MSIFNEITYKKWSEDICEIGHNSIFMRNEWERAIHLELPFVSYKHYRYRNTHLVRITQIHKRLTKAPFSDGSDVLVLDNSLLDTEQFQSDLNTQFGKEIRLRVHERFSPVFKIENNLDTMLDSVVAHDYIVDLEEPLLPKVRKTLRHILSLPVIGEIKRVDDIKTIDIAYDLYVYHMRSVRNFAMPKHLFVSLVSKYDGELWVWRNNGEVGAMAIFVPFGTEVIYSLSAANAEAFAAHAPHHLLYTALEYYRKIGIKHASLGATGVGSSLEVFKRGWRGQKYQIWEINNSSRNIGRTSRARDLIGYVPLALYPFVTNKIAKYFM